MVRSRESQDRNNEKSRLWRIANRERKYHTNKVWRAANKDKVYRASEKCRLKQVYGITLEEYEQMSRGQGDVCKICKEPEKKLARKLSIDHNHDTGEIRGLLCSLCNLMLGHAKDSILILESAIVYLQRSKQ